MSLEDFVASDPSFESLKKMSEQLAVEFVASADSDTYTRGQRDDVHENMLMKQQYFLLYEEMSYVLNAGNIGRVETLFLPWMFIFQGCCYVEFVLEHSPSVSVRLRLFPSVLHPSITSVATRSARSR